MNISELNNSLLDAVYDPIIDSIALGFLKKIVFKTDRFIKGEYNNNDLYNFLFTDPEVISKFPECSIIIGSHDPLREESQILLDFFIKNKVKADLHEIFFHCHGFMNLPPLVDNYYKQGVDVSVELLKSKLEII